MKHLKRFGLVLAIAAATIGFQKLHLASEAAFEPPVFEPSGDRDYTSTREVNRLEIDEASGAVTAWTSGGKLRFASGVWQKFPTKNFVAQPVEFRPSGAVQWRGQKVSADFDGLRVGAGQTARRTAFPPSSGTHISALLPREKELWAGVFGDGIWAWNGARWTRPLVVPPQAREVTALAQGKDNSIWLGTRREGVWRWKSGAWQQFLQADEPFAHNVQTLQSFGGALWASTLEDGLVRRDVRGWTHFGKGVLSSNAPRQMVVFRGCLYVRHSNEVVDCFDGKMWQKHIFPGLPRRQIISLAADAGHLYLGQWGGWSEWDGEKFVHHLKIPVLQIVPLMQIFPDPLQDGKLWLGTENRGLFEWDETRQTLRHFDERDGLPDDWITGIARGEKTLWVGTFNGGLASRNDGETRWHSSPDLGKLGVSALAVEGEKMWVGTHFGLYRRNEKEFSLDESLAPDKREIQALLPTTHGLWIGTRNGLLFRTRSALPTR